MRLLLLFLAGAAGVAMALQGTLNSALGKGIGVLQATFVVHLIGAAAAGLLLLVPEVGRSGNIAKIFQVPWYYLLGGIIGVFILYGVVASLPRLGAAVATTAIIVGQVGMAMVIDHLGFFGLTRMSFTWVKLIGLALLATGARLILR